MSPAELNSLGSRGQHLASSPARIDFELFMQASQDPFHPEDNPHGKFPLNVAENTPMIPLLKARLDAILSQASMPEWVFQYTATTGHPEVRAEVAKFMSEHLCHTAIAPDAIGFAAGASAIIEISSFVLADPGDVVVIPAPSYPMYTKDLGLKSGMQRYDLQTHVDLEDHGSLGPVTTELLDKALTDLNAHGRKFRMLLITSPDNPTGCMYSETQLRELADWCIKHEVHLVVNEIYGLSLIDTQDEALKDDYPEALAAYSFAQLMAEKQSEYLHLWYAMSKDFAMSGMRFGIVHSLNQAFMAGLSNSNIPHMVSNLTQWLVGEMFKDTDFIEGYIRENTKRLTRSYKVVVEALKKLGLPYVPSRGSLFVWADFSRFLSEDSDAGQEQLWVDIFDKTGVLLTPGAGFQHEAKGLFRIVHTAVPTEHLKVAMDRMVAYLGKL